MNIPKLHVTSENATVTASLQKKKARLISASRADETKRAIRKHWTKFQHWCERGGYVAFPTLPHILEEYLIYRSEENIKSSTVDQIKWAIDYRHKVSGEIPPGNYQSVKSIVSGIKRTMKHRIHQKKALTPDCYKKYKFDDSARGVREKLIIILGFSGGFRRSELAAMRLADIEFNAYGMRIFIPFSKTNQEGANEYVDIVHATDKQWCPVETLKQWTSMAEVTTGYVLRNILKSGKIGSRLSTVAIYNIVKSVVGTLVDDPENYSCHSLRSGFATFMLDKKVPVNIVAKQLRHKKLETTLRYDRNTVMDSLKGLY